MINRELIRLKVLQSVYAYYVGGDTDKDTAKKTLHEGVAASYDLYHMLLMLMVDVTTRAKEKADAEDEAARLRGEARRANRKFADNLFVAQLAENKQLLSFKSHMERGWMNEETFLQRFLQRIMETDVYATYMSEPSRSYEEDRSLWRTLYKKLVYEDVPAKAPDETEDVCASGTEPPCEEGENPEQEEEAARGEIETLLEDYSIYWNSDKRVIDTFVLKTIKRFQEENGAEQPLLPDFESEADRQFSEDLLRYTLDEEKRSRALIEKHAKKGWSLDRLPIMEVVIMQMALTEILHFPDVPLSVTLNEYLSLTSMYASPRSISYINGVLDSAAREMREEGLILKAVRKEKRHSR